MAAGDTIQVFFSFSGPSYLNYQPAAGVEVVILQTDDFTTHYLYLYNGTLEANMYNAAYTPNAAGAKLMKLCINNTNYMRMYSYNAGASTGAVCGIQTK